MAVGYARRAKSASIVRQAPRSRIGAKIERFPFPGAVQRRAQPEAERSPGPRMRICEAQYALERAKDAPLRGRVLALDPGQHSASDFVLASCFRERETAYLSANARCWAVA